MRKSFRHACRFLRHNEKIAGYLKAIERNATLLSEIRSALPPPLNEHCLHASLEAEVLTLVADSPVWSSRLRFFTPELQQRLSPRYGSIATCRIRIQPRSALQTAAPGTAKANSTRKLSAKTAQHLIEVAAGIEDAPLASALRRLATAGAKDD